MAKKLKGSGRADPHIPRVMLLPVPAISAQTMSLRAHLGLVAMREGKGSFVIATHLLGVMYLAYLLHEEPLGELKLRAFNTTQDVLRRSVASAKRDGVWRVDQNDSWCLEQVVTLHDVQMQSMPAYLIAKARLTLHHLLDNDKFADVTISSVNRLSLAPK